MKIDDKILGVKGLGILMSVQQPRADNFFTLTDCVLEHIRILSIKGCIILKKICNSLHYLKFICKEHYPINLNTPTAFFKAHYALKQ